MKKGFAYGADLGWMTQLEDRGFRWMGENGKTISCLDAVKEKGTDSVRFRVFVDPPEDSYARDAEGNICMLGYCDAESVAEAACRARDKGMRIMLDLHYSDEFADPKKQYIPKAWEGLDHEELCRKVSEHTIHVLEVMKEKGIVPEWVQVGNEINPGMMHPMGDLETHPTELVDYINRGYDAVKKVFPDCKVILHLATGQHPKWVMPFLENFFENNGKTDILGFSDYPYWCDLINKEDPDEAIDSSMAHWKQCINMYRERFHKPVMIVEIGGPEYEAEETREMIGNTIKMLQSIPDGEGLGVFYWEPEVCSEVLPDAYPLGASRLVKNYTLQLTDALAAYKDCILSGAL